MRKSFKHRTEIEIRKKRDISKEPAMIELKELLEHMTDQEQGRTLDHIEKIERR